MLARRPGRAVGRRFTQGQRPRAGLLTRLLLLAPLAALQI